jgi:hypothetical protein
MSDMGLIVGVVWALLRPPMFRFQRNQDGSMTDHARRAMQDAIGMTSGSGALARAVATYDA